MHTWSSIMQKNSGGCSRKENKMRGRKATGTVSMEQQIEKAQAKVIKTKAAYDKAVDELQKLLDKRDAIRKDELWAAIIKSQKSYEEIMHFISADINSDEESE